MSRLYSVPVPVLCQHFHSVMNSIIIVQITDVSSSCDYTVFVRSYKVQIVLINVLTFSNDELTKIKALTLTKN